MAKKILTYTTVPLSSEWNRRDRRFLGVSEAIVSVDFPDNSARLGRGVCRIVSNDFSPKFT